MCSIINLLYYPSHVNVSVFTWIDLLNARFNSFPLLNLFEGYFHCGIFRYIMIQWTVEMRMGRIGGKVQFKTSVFNERSPINSIEFPSIKICPFSCYRRDLKLKCTT